MKITDLVERVKLVNTEDKKETRDTSFDTCDYVYLESFDDIKNLSPNQKTTAVTDWALANGGSHKWGKTAPNGAACVASTLLRYNPNPLILTPASYDGSLQYNRPDDASLAWCPTMCLNLSTFLSIRKDVSDFGKVGVVKDTEGNIIAHTIEMGEYPRTKVSSKERDVFEKLLQSGKIRKTGQQYLGHYYKDGSFVMHDEYKIGGQKYVRVFTKREQEGNIYNDGTKMAPSGTWEWEKVEPLVWRVRNWDQMPTSINPEGNGRAKSIYIRTDEAIISGIPFYPSCGDMFHRDIMWQNSLSRAVLNGYDLHAEIDSGNGNIEYKHNQNFNFIGRGFLSEIFSGMAIFEDARNKKQQVEETPTRSK